MDGKKSHTKLTRTSASLTRSSYTGEFSPETVDLEEQKPHSKYSGRPGLANWKSVFVILLLSTYTLFSFFNRENIPASEKLLLALIFIAVFLFLVSRNRDLVNRSSYFCKQFCNEFSRRFGGSCFTSKNDSKRVQWFIGEPNLNQIEIKKQSKKTVREGVELYNNGDCYEGEFHKGKCNGSGVYSFKLNGRYEGDWIDGKYDGYGIESWTKGSRYRGQYRQGLRHGYGVYKFYNGDTYSGEWCNGQSNGVGVQTCDDGSYFVGEFKFGIKHGLGCYHFRNGDRYAGEYFGDKVHGFGVYHFANGHCYEGSWHEGKKQGYGMYTFRNGDTVTQSGEWDGGILKTPLPSITDAVLRAVQAARKIAENAIHLHQVDEQVNKAVMTANRAATAARVAAVKAVQNQIDGKFCNTDNLNM